MMGPYFQQPRKKINQKAQGKKKLAGGGAYVPHSRHLVVKAKLSCAPNHMSPENGVPPGHKTKRQSALPKFRRRRPTKTALRPERAWLDKVQLLYCAVRRGCKS